jgi:hypothetical protein
LIQLQELTLEIQLAIPGSALEKLHFLEWLALDFLLEEHMEEEDLEISLLFSGKNILSDVNCENL